MSELEWNETTERVEETNGKWKITSVDIAAGKTMRVDIDGRKGESLRIRFEVAHGRSIDFFSAVMDSGEA